MGKIITIAAMFFGFISSAYSLQCPDNYEEKQEKLTLSKFQHSDIVVWAKWKDEFGVESDTLQVISSWKGNASGVVLGRFILSPDIQRDEPFILPRILAHY